MDPLLLDIPEGLGVDEDPATWVDLSVTNGVLSGVIILLGALWAMYAFQRLWQQSLAEDAADGLAAAKARGLTIEPVGFRSRLVAIGAIGSQPVRVEWRGGLLGARSRVVLGDVDARVPLITSAVELDGALARITALSAPAA
jgi:hypothetical protein